jgi:hypothetical protein
MPGTSGHGVGPSLVDAVKTAAEDMVDLIGAQIRLARMEAVKDLGEMARRPIRIGLFLPFLLGGYGFAMAALACLLARPLGIAAGLAVVALGQLVVGGVGILVTQRRGAPVKLLERSGAEASASVSQAVTAISSAQHRQAEPNGPPLEIRSVTNPREGDSGEHPRKAAPHVE